MTGRGVGSSVGRRMGLLLLAGAGQSLVLNLLLLVALGLTYWESREQELDGKLTLWWLSAVALVHVPAYLALRVWGFYRRRSAQGGAT